MEIMDFVRGVKIRILWLNIHPCDAKVFLIEWQSYGYEKCCK